MAATAEFLIRGGLQQWLADRISVADVAVTLADTTLSIRIDYIVLATGEAASATFTREAAP